MLAEVATQAEAADAMIPIDQVLDDGPGSVVAAIVDKDDLERLGAPFEHGRQSAAELAQRVLGAVHRYHDGQRRHGDIAFGGHCSRVWIGAVRTVTATQVMSRPTGSTGPTLPVAIDRGGYAARRGSW